MTHWETITRALHLAGGGPLPRSAFDSEIESDEAARAGLKRAKEHGLVTSLGVHRKATWTLTQLGIDWCQGRIKVVSHSRLRLVETEPERQKRIARLVADSTEAFEACACLTTRQREILVLIAKGFTWQETAARLGITAGSLSQQKERICRHLGCDKTIEAAVIATKAGIV